MRRPVATLVAALLLSFAGPVSARDPLEPRSAAAPTPETEPTAADPTGRWIVIYRDGTDVAASSARQARTGGFVPDQTFSHAFKGFAARLGAGQVAALKRDRSVLAVVPDEKIELTAQSFPTGISRVGARQSATAKIDGIDERVDADVAIVDTGIAKVADLNVVGGYNCSTSNRTLYRDVYGHGTHVAGTVGAIDNGLGVVGVAPGVRLWAVKVLNDNGEGLLSWYACGIDWITAQRDPIDPSRPLIEAANMSITKWGKDDGNCGATNKDVLHAAICRAVKEGTTIVAAAANDSGNASLRVPGSYNEVITVSALADTDGKPGALGGNRCYSWGSYDSDDTFANFSNFGADVDLIAPGKCIWSTVPGGGYKYSSGTSMAAPHVTGAVALLKSVRPYLTPLEVKEALQYLGTLDWKITSDPDSKHEKLLDVSKIGPHGSFSVAVGPEATLSEAGGEAAYPITLTRSTTSFERVYFRAEYLPRGVRAFFEPSSVYGFAGVATTMTLLVPRGVAPGTYEFSVIASEHTIAAAATSTLVVRSDIPTANPPTTDAALGGVIGTASVPARIAWPAATDPSNSIAGYELQTSRNGGAWSASTAFASSPRVTTAVQGLATTYQYRLRARDKVGNWSPWVSGATTSTAFVQDTSTAVTYSGAWTRHPYAYASGGVEHYATTQGASARTTFSGRAVAIVGPIGPTRGYANVYIDGVYASTVSFHGEQGASRVVTYSDGFGSLATHTIELRVVGNGRVDLDTFVIFR